MREAFFKIAARYPADVLKTFIYYKPKRIVTSMSKSMIFNFGADQSRAVNPAGPPVVPYPPLAIGLLLVSLAVALVHFGIGAVSTAELSRIVGVTLFLVTFTLPTYFAAWATPPTSGDLLLYCLFGLGLAAGAILVAARSALPPASMALACPWWRRRAEPTRRAGCVGGRNIRPGPRGGIAPQHAAGRLG